jgi:hypothetical protein
LKQKVLRHANNRYTNKNIVEDSIMQTLTQKGDVQPRSFLPVVIAILFVIDIVLVYLVVPKTINCSGQNNPLILGYDWVCVFRPAVITLFHGHTPYTGLYFNPPWILLLLSPLALLPSELGAAAIAVICAAAFAVAGARLGMSKTSLLFLTFNLFMWLDARQGNIDWLVALGAILPPQIGLFLVVTKPQAGIAIVIFWFIEALRQGGIRQAIRVFAPVTVAYLLSFILFGWWIIPPGWLVPHQLNYSLWPVSLPIGLALLAVALKKRDIRRAITASPFLSPYVLTMTWSLAILGLEGWEIAAAVIGVLLIHILVPNFGLYPIHLLP